MSTDGRQLIHSTRLRELNDGYYLRVACKSEQPIRGSIVEAWETGRGPKRITVGREAYRNRQWVYYDYTSCVEP